MIDAHVHPTAKACTLEDDLLASAIDNFVPRDSCEREKEARSAMQVRGSQRRLLLSPSRWLDTH